MQRLSNERLDPAWSFATFYLVQDSFGLMLEWAGMWADALQVGGWVGVLREVGGWVGRGAGGSQGGGWQRAG